MTRPAVLDRDVAHEVDHTREQDLVARAATGDEAAFTRIVASYHPDLLRVAFVVGGGDQDLAEDAVQHAWQIAWRRLRDLRDPTRVRSWLVAVAANEARALLRRQSRTRAWSLEATQARGGDEPQVWPAGTDPELLDLSMALERLDPTDRGLLALRYVIGLNATEIAEVVGGRPGGVRSRLSRLVARLRRDLGDE